MNEMVTRERTSIYHLGESMQKGISRTKVKVLSKDYIFHVAILYWFILHFSHNFKNWISNLKPNITYNIIKTQISFLHQALRYSQIYNFTLNHDYKFKTIICKKTFEYWNLKRYICFYFLNVWNTWIPFVEYIKVRKK
jgi:hypothetical protein